MGHKTMKIDGEWLVCACGQKLARIDDEGIKIVCRGTPFTGRHYSVLVPSRIETICDCDKE